MKIFPRTVATAISFLALITATCHPIGNGTVTVLVTIAPPDGPLHIVGLRPPEKAGDAPKVVLQNTSSRAISDFEVEALLGNSRDMHDGNDLKYGIGLPSGFRIPPLWPEERAILPNAKQEAHEQELEAHHLAHWAAYLHSDCLHAAVIIKQVRFVDGTTWQPDSTSEQRQKMWKQTIRAESTNSCENPPLTQETLDQIKSSGFPEGKRTAANAKIVPFYSFSCPIQMMGGSLSAICSM
jgi:hypothetical protein